MIENKTKMDYATLNEFSMFHIMRNKILFIMTWLFLALILAYDVFSIVSVGVEALTDLTVLIGFVLVIFIILIWFVMPRLMNKKSPALGMMIDYTFDESEVRLNAVKEEINETATVGYPMVYRVYEGKNYFYLYISKNQGYIISKNGFVDAKEADFRDFLKSKFDAKILKIKNPK